MNKKTILAVASGGGHFLQLMRIQPAFENHEVVFVTTFNGYSKIFPMANIMEVQDACLKEKFKIIILALQILMIILRIQPNIVISTGAAPGFFAVFFGKLLGAKTIWLDSIANAEKMSLSGRMVKNYADLWLTQWEHLSTSEGPYYQGRIF